MSAIQSTIWASQIPVQISLSPSLYSTPSPEPPPESTRNSPKPSSKPSNPHIGSSSPKPSSRIVPKVVDYVQAAEPPLPYITRVPRLSYLPLLLPKLSAFFGKRLSNFSFEGIELMPLPVGLLVDLYGPGLPWKIEVGDGFGGGMKDLKGVEDSWMNSVKEVRQHSFRLNLLSLVHWFCPCFVLPLPTALLDATYISLTLHQADFLRNGTGKAIMSLSREDSTSLFHSVLDLDLSTYSRLYSRLLTSQPLRHVPIRIFIPQPESPTSPPASPLPHLGTPKSAAVSNAGSFKVVQGLVPARGSGREQQTVGMALNALLPGLFPSRRDAILAEAILHGVRVPMNAPVEEVMREAAYADGWVCLVVVMLN